MDHLEHLRTLAHLAKASQALPRPHRRDLGPAKVEEAQQERAAAVFDAYLQRTPSAMRDLGVPDLAFDKDLIADLELSERPSPRAILVPQG